MTQTKLINALIENTKRLPQVSAFLQTFICWIIFWNRLDIHIFVLWGPKWHEKFHVKSEGSVNCPSKLCHVVSSIGSQRIMNYDFWITDAIDFEPNLQHSPKRCKFFKIASFILNFSAILINLHVLGEWWRFASKLIASVIQQT